jgi:parallel beta-helix repeat protein
MARDHCNTLGKLSEGLCAGGDSIAKEGTFRVSRRTLLSQILHIGYGIPALSSLALATGCTTTTAPDKATTATRVDLGTPTAAMVGTGQNDSPAATQASIADGCFADGAFRRLWATTDAPPGAQIYVWGPMPFTSGVWESYQEAPNGRRLVQYFDKARMELTISGGPVTAGLLPVELITGKQQTGANSFLQREPAQVPVVGDPENSFPTYADLGPLQAPEADKAAQGAQITKLINPDGSLGTFEPAATDTAAKAIAYDSQTKHNVPRTFAEFRSSPLYGGSQAIGLAVTEPVWSNVRVANNVVPVLIQAFEGRVLTYTPSNPDSSQVEYGNVGRSYFRWRYGALSAASADCTGLPPQEVHVVTAYGAKGDGVTNDAPAIQASLDAAGRAGGGIVLFPPGIYQIEDTLSYSTNLTLQGTDSSVAIIRNATTRRANQRMLAPRAIGVSNVRIADLTFDQRADAYGETPDQMLLSVDGTTNVAVTRCVFRNVQTVAIWCDSIGGTVTANHSVTQCRVTSSYGDGFSYFGKCMVFTIQANLIEQTKDDAIAVQDHGAGNYPQQVTISGNTIQDCTIANGLGSTANGINCFGGDHVRILNNTVKAVYSNGVAVLKGSARRSTNIEVSGNSIDRAGTPTAPRDVPGNGIYLYGADNVTGSGNRASNSRHAGLAIKEASGVTFTGDFAASSLAGISVQESRDIALSDCHVSNSGATPGSAQPYGLFLNGAGKGCDHVRVTGCRFDNGLDGLARTQQYGLFCIAGTLTNITLTDNDFSGNTSAGRNEILPMTGQFRHNTGVSDWR